MPILKRHIPLILIGLISACINVPEIDTNTPDSGTPSTTQPDAGNPGSGDAGAIDTVRPSITRSIPANGSTNIALNAGLEFEFSEPMDVSTVQISISPPVQIGVPTWSDGNTRWVVHPASNLAQNATYTLTVNGKDVAGNTLTGTRVVSFTTTGPAPDTTAPTQISFAPGNLDTGIERTTSITILFSEPMDKASVQSAFAIVSPVSFNSGVFTWNEAGTEMKFKPNTDFSNGVDVNWRVSTAAKDPSGNTLQSAITSTFRIVRVNTITVDFDPPTSGHLDNTAYFRQTYYNFEPVGDMYDNSANRLFIGFKLDALPENTVSITRSTLNWWVTGKQGDPSKELGNLLLEGVYIGDLLDGSGVEGGINPKAVEDFNATPQSPAINVPIPNSISSTQISLEVTSLVQKDWTAQAAHNKRSQFRLRFEKGTNGNSLSDMLFSDVERDPKLAVLEVTYEYP